MKLWSLNFISLCWLSFLHTWQTRKEQKCQPSFSFSEWDYNHRHTWKSWQLPYKHITSKRDKREGDLRSCEIRERCLVWECDSTGLVIEVSVSTMLGRLAVVVVVVVAGTDAESFLHEGKHRWFGSWPSCVVVLYVGLFSCLLVVFLRVLSCHPLSFYSSVI